jgi:3-oxoacyl-ACP reductase-like protein
MLNKRGMFVKYIGETENVTIQDSTPKVSGGKTKTNIEPMEAPAVEGKASESEPTETI